MNLIAVLYFLAIDFNTFLAAAGPILAVVISGGFTYLGVHINNKAKKKDQQLAEHAQDFEGIKTGQEFMKDALADARGQVERLKEENKKLDVINEELEAQNRRLELLHISDERKIAHLEASLRNVEDTHNER